MRQLMQTRKCKHDFRFLPAQLHQWLSFDKNTLKKLFLHQVFYRRHTPLLLPLLPLHLVLFPLCTHPHSLPSFFLSSFCFNPSSVITHFLLLSSLPCYFLLFSYTLFLPTCPCLFLLSLSSFFFRQFIVTMDNGRRQKKGMEDRFSDLVNLT